MSKIHRQDPPVPDARWPTPPPQGCHSKFLATGQRCAEDDLLSQDTKTLSSQDHVRAHRHDRVFAAEVARDAR